MNARAASDRDLRDLVSWIGEQRDLMLGDLADYVQLETPSDDLPSLARGREWIREWMSRRLGEPASERCVSGEDSYGATVVLDYAATDAGAAAGVVTALAHYDTVWPLGTLKSMPFSIQDDIIRGPGVFDMKAGLVQAVWAVSSLRHLGLACPPMRWVLTGDEEVGSISSRPVIEQSCAGAAAVLVFEPSANAAVKTGRKGIGLFEAHFTGVEAHAGLDPKAGASAILALAAMIAALDEAQNLDAGTSINVGVVRGGTRGNVTAGSAYAAIDVRVSDAQESARIDAVFAGWSPRDPRVTYTLDGGWNRPPMTRSPQIAALYERARGVAARLGFDLHETSVGGASDGNFAAAIGLPVLDGFGAVGDGAHARHEHATISGMLERSALAAGLLHSLT